MLALDVWEHAFYLDFHNMKQDYVRVFLEKLVNWSFVAQNLRFVSLAVSLSLRRSSPVSDAFFVYHGLILYFLHVKSEIRACIFTNTYARIIFLAHATGNRKMQPTGALL